MRLGLLPPNLIHHGPKFRSLSGPGVKNVPGSVIAHPHRTCGALAGHTKSGMENGEELMDEMPSFGVCRCCGRGVSSEAPECPGCGQPAPFAKTWQDQARGLARSGNAVQAIKIVRERTGADFESAKRTVEGLAQ